MRAKRVAAFCLGMLLIWFGHAHAILGLTGSYQSVTRCGLLEMLIGISLVLIATIRPTSL